MPPSKSRKIAVLGYRSVGKSSLTIQFVDSYDPTIENVFTKTMALNGQQYNLQLVDTAGQSCTTDVNGYALIYSVTSYKRKPIILVGNKDLHMERVIGYEEGKALAESWSAAFLESSAKHNLTVVEVFRRMVLEVEQMEGGQPQQWSPPPDPRSFC
uniref:Uncharacterized protein n=1 Tax=Poecilia mexicana TaxID=48701 RepID=A0A3B3WCZ7_9TELE